MRKILLVFAVCVCSAVFAENIVLDLSNPGDFPIEYDETGLWADVFNNDAIVIHKNLCFRTLLLIPIIQMDSLPAR